MEHERNTKKNSLDMISRVRALNSPKKILIVFHVISLCE